MKKDIMSCTFAEFSEYCNARACDGGWGLDTAIACITAMNAVNAIRPLFGRRKAREKRWQEIRSKYFKPEFVIER